MVLKDKININNRLVTALSFMEHCECMADIGSDHGYSSVYAIKENISDSVIATDISAPSLAKTERLVKEFCLQDKIECRCGNGLSVLKKNEANAAFIAGMGADLIADIIEQSEDVAKALDYMVLQPMNSAIPLRKRIIEMGYRIIEEGIVIDNEKFYQIIKCTAGCQKNVTQEQIELGFFVYNKHIPLCKEYIEHMIGHYEDILLYVGGNRTDSASSKIIEANEKIRLYKEALKWAVQQ